MFAVLLAPLLLHAAAPGEEATTEVPGLNRAIEVGAGVGLSGFAFPAAMRVGATLEAGGDDRNNTRVAPIVGLDWTRASWIQPLGRGFIDTIDVSAGVRYSLRWGPIMELIGGVMMGGALRLLTQSSGAFAHLGLAWKVNAGLRLSLGERFLILLCPAELKGTLWLLKPGNSERVSLAFAPWAGVGLRL